MPANTQGVRPSGFKTLFADNVTTSAASYAAGSASYTGDTLAQAIENLLAGETSIGIIRDPRKSHGIFPGGLLFQFFGVGANNTELAVRIEGWSIYDDNVLNSSAVSTDVGKPFLVPSAMWRGGLALANNVFKTSSGIRFADDILAAPAPVAYTRGTNIGNDDADPVVWDAATDANFASMYVEDAFWLFDFYTVKLNVLTGGTGAATSCNCLVREMH